MIKYNEAKNYYLVRYSKRHPVTKKTLSITRVNIKTKVEAEKIYKELIIKLDQKINSIVHPLWPEVMDKFIEHFKNRGIANNTIFNYRSALYAHTFKKWGNKHINEITTSNIRDLIFEDLSERSPSLKKDVLKYIRAVFNYAIDAGFIFRDPTPKIKFKKNKKIKAVLNESEISFLLQTAENFLKYRERRSAQISPKNDALHFKKDDWNQLPKERQKEIKTEFGIKPKLAKEGFVYFKKEKELNPIPAYVYQKINYSKKMEELRNEKSFLN
jgi:hypothetical protein